MKCKICGSMAINHNLHGRDGSEPELCDVCFWREKFKKFVYSVELDETKDNPKKWFMCPKCKSVWELKND